MDSSALDKTRDQLAGCESPFLIGVRHHSATMARVIPGILDAFRPETVLVELPEEFAEWLPWLGHEDLQAPVALAATGAGTSLSFYPFADFSPELAAIRWACRHDVPVLPCDLPLGDRQTVDRDAASISSSGLLDRLLRRTQTRDVGTLWERLVETPGVDASAEAIRRAGLLFGWALRSNDGTASPYDLARERHMRDCIARTGARTAVVVGAYHAAALLPEPMLWSPPDLPAADDGTAERAELATAMIPYSFEQLDERSGYPAGIRDPHWHQRVFHARNIEDINADTGDLIVAICRELRSAGHPVNAADGKEVLRMAGDLAALRGLPAPGRGELIESVQSCLTHGELFGLGRAVAQALETVLVGSQAGALPSEVPRSGLAPHIESLLAELNLPGPDSLATEPKRMRLDPLRSRLDRAREVTLHRLTTCGIAYAKNVTVGDSSPRDNLTQVWDVNWEHATAAMIELSASRGATLEQACLGQLVSMGFGLPVEDWTTGQLKLVEQAAECGIGSLVKSGLRWLMGPFILIADLAALTRAMTLIERVRLGHIPGLPATADDAREPFVSPFQVPPEIQPTPLLQAAIAQLEGLIGSEVLDDVAAVLDLILWFQQQPGELQFQDDTDNASDGGASVGLDAGRLVWILKRFADRGSALMQGAGHAGLNLLGTTTDEELGTTVSGWISGAVNRELRRQLRDRLQAVVLIASPKLAVSFDCLDAIEEQVSQLSDQDFLNRLAALRGGFHVLAPAVRDRLLHQLLTRIPDTVATATPQDVDPVLLGFRAEAEEAGRIALAELMPELTLATTTFAVADAPERVCHVARAESQICLADRWRLILGRQQEQLPPSCCGAAQSLDELYGNGCGEGAVGIGGGSGAGHEAPYPNVRQWADELEGLFGEDICEEVLADALEAGRSAVLTVLDAETVTPSMDLLEQVLSMKGALPAGQTDKLRQIARRIVDELARELATRLRPALTGLSTPRPTRRRTTRLDLHRTIRANLHTARMHDDKPPTLVPERLVFRQPARRSMDWHITFVVDVSGSMEPSVIYSAMMAAIFSGLPAVSVQFLAFSTEVIDFTDRVSDPLEMLLEVRVGGGTHIAKGLRAARERLKVPARSIVLLVTDFEEGLPVGRLLSEARTLVETGARVLGLAALNDDGQPRYNRQIAGQVAGCGVPVAALSPSQLARWVGEQIKG
jgi:Mg-chelatase subunit ChlD